MEQNSRTNNLTSLRPRCGGVEKCALRPRCGGVEKCALSCAVTKYLIAVQKT